MDRQTPAAPLEEPWTHGGGELSMTQSRSSSFVGCSLKLGCGCVPTSWAAARDVFSRARPRGIELDGFDAIVLGRCGAFELVAGGAVVIRGAGESSSNVAALSQLCLQAATSSWSGAALALVQAALHRAGRRPPCRDWSHAETSSWGGSESIGLFGIRAARVTSCTSTPR